VYQNTGGIFTENTNINLPGISSGSSEFGDYDNDGDLDILITGSSDNGDIAKIYRNNLHVSNTLPSEPENLSAIVSGQNVLLSWSAGNDAETLSASGLNYNIRIGSSPGACDILAPMALPLSNGFRQIVEGGVIQDLTTTVNIHSVGTYYWGVQSIDTSFSGSSFSSEYSFTITDVAPIPGNNGILTSSSYLTSASEKILTWDIASDAISLTSSLEYRIYSSTVSYGDNIYNNSSGYFSEDTGIHLTGVSSGSAAFGDYDNDGDLDILISGTSDSGSIATVYQNTGGNFSEYTSFNFKGSSTFGDYDNDGDLDILISRYSDTIVYKNTQGNFSVDTDMNLPGVGSNGTYIVGDYDNDGNLDLLITGSYMASVYRNNIKTWNTTPSEPSNLSANVSGTRAALSWSAGSDAESLSSCLI
jgi:hypothetical protein